MNDRKCGTCKHWHENDPDPANLTAKPPGQCRQGPPQLITLPIRGGVQISAHYPILPAAFPACSQFEAILDMSRCMSVLPDGGK